MGGSEQDIRGSDANRLTSEDQGGLRIDQGWMGAINREVQGKSETRRRSLTEEYQRQQQNTGERVGGSNESIRRGNTNILISEDQGD